MTELTRLELIREAVTAMKGRPITCAQIANLLRAAQLLDGVPNPNEHVNLQLYSLRARGFPVEKLRSQTWRWNGNPKEATE